MFVLTRISDVIAIHPMLFDGDYTKVLKEEIDRKYCNKVIADVGLCISVYDFIAIGDALIHPSEGDSHTQVEFRMIVFRPFIGEVLKGKILSCNENHIRITMEFMQDILIPSYALQTPSHFDTYERLWVWTFTDSAEKFHMDLNEEIRFRVTNVNFTQVHKTAKGMQATTSESTEKKDKASLKRGNLDDKRRRLSSVDLSDSDPTPSAMQILGTIDEDGLGLTSWWIEAS
ncbi:unnamed protein product [Albugo candida]|uniref:DNA-directed RNA polymerase III subunit RPC8 n=2 Tax=Albugo candida TaxID=65357 RepID=A0A024GIJ1_9STRA|nr:unnamed protein product [Albugo candida]|eukprot:CCI46337.1 unnamed protein product [Albugo candida]